MFLHWPPVNAKAQREGRYQASGDQPVPRAEVGLGGNLGPGRQCGRLDLRCFPKFPPTAQVLIHEARPEFPRLPLPSATRTCWREWACPAHFPVPA